MLSPGNESTPCDWISSHRSGLSSSEATHCPSQSSLELFLLLFLCPAGAGMQPEGLYQVTGIRQFAPVSYQSQESNNSFNTELPKTQA